ncbi:MAG: hypothetical protein FWE28_06115 [Oscillospiraceae bacterium]|nr:hypothetical protein [Oscillospiraceae bacterium]
MSRLKRLGPVAALLLLVLFLSGCNALIEGTPHLVITPHEIEPPSHYPEDYIEIADQGELEQAIWHMIEHHVETGLFRITDTEIVVTDVIDAVLQEPLGAFATRSITPQILSEQHGFLEVELRIPFQKSAEQIAGIRSIQNPTSAMALLERMLRDGETYLAMQMPTHIADVVFLEGVLRDFYYSHALEVVLLPNIETSLYPHSGSGNQRIAEFQLYFGFGQTSLSRMRADLQYAAHSLIQDMPEYLETVYDQIVWLAAALNNRVEQVLHVAPWNPLYDTAFGALVDGVAASEGLAMAMMALLELLGIDAMVVQGELAGVAHTWNLVEIDEYFYHIDVSRLHELGPSYALFVPDEIMLFENDYSWDATHYPRADGPFRYIGVPPEYGGY